MDFIIFEGQFVLFGGCVGEFNGPILEVTAMPPHVACWLAVKHMELANTRLKMEKMIEVLVAYMVFLQPVRLGRSSLGT